MSEIPRALREWMERETGDFYPNEMRLCCEAMAVALEWAAENLEDIEGGFLMGEALDTITALRAFPETPNQEPR